MLSADIEPDPSNRGAAEPRLRPRGHPDRRTERLFERKRR